MIDEVNVLHQETTTALEHPFLVGNKVQTSSKTGNLKTDPFTEGIKKKKFIYIGTIFITAILMLSLVYWYIFYFNRSRIVILDPSGNLSVQLNTQTISPEPTEKGTAIQAQAGQYLLTIKKPNYLPFTQVIKLNRGKTIEVRPTFTLLDNSEVSDSGYSTTVDYVRPSSDEKSLYFLGDDRQSLYRMEIQNQSQIKITVNPLSGVSDVQWPPKLDMALVAQDDGIYLQEIPIHEFVNQGIYQIAGNEVISPTWDPNNPARMAFAYFPENGEKTLVFSDKRASKLDRKADLSGLENPKLIWSADSAYIMLVNRSTDYTKNNLWLYSTKNGEIQQITQDGYITDASFSPGNQNILFEQLNKDSDNDNHTLKVIKQKDNYSKIYSLDIQNRVAKAAWKDGSHIYLPEDADSNILVLVDVDKKSTREIPFNFNQTLDIQGMLYFSSNKNLIFYTNQSIYTINLATE